MRPRLLLDAPATTALGADLVRALEQVPSPGSGPWVLYLEGDLGAGKTTLARGLLAALGHQGRVRSPTYTLVESYQTAGRQVHHFDLYRLGDPEELEYLGLRDLLEADALWLVEWPERGGAMLPDPDVRLCLRPEGRGRRAELRPASPRGERWLAALEALGGP